MIAVLLTLLEPPGFGDFCKKNQQFSVALPTWSSFRVILAHVAWTRTFWPPWPTLPGPGCQPL